MTLFNLLWCVFASANFDAQADVLLSYVPLSKQQMLYRESVGIDASGNLWLLGYWGRGVYVSLINSKGEIVLDKVDIPADLRGYSCIPLEILFDRWGNAHISFKLSHMDRQSSSSHLVRVTPEGHVNDYSSWLDNYRTLSPVRMKMIPADTLFIIGRDKGSVLPGYPYRYRYIRGILSSSGVELVNENLFLVDRDALGNSTPVFLISGQLTRRDHFMDWQEGLGLGTYLSYADDELAPETLYVDRLSLKKEDNYLRERIGMYIWRDYVWRSYEDTWISLMTLVPYKKGGYVLYIPEPKGNYLTGGVNIIRLDEEGVPIDPADLKGGGDYSSKPFDRLPKTAESQVSFGWWSAQSYKPRRDSAYVSFWGCDDEGNLYSYRKFQKYGEEE